MPQVRSDTKVGLLYSEDTGMKSVCMWRMNRCEYVWGLVTEIALPSCTMLLIMCSVRFRIL